MDNLSLLTAVAAGAASFLSPCVLPMVPGYIGLVSGYSAQELRAGEVELGRVTRTTGLFVLGFTLVFVLVFGAAATSIGRLLAVPQFQFVSGVLIILMGLVRGGDRGIDPAVSDAVAARSGGSPSTPTASAR